MDLSIQVNNTPRKTAEKGNDLQTPVITEKTKRKPTRQFT